MGGWFLEDALLSTLVEDILHLTGIDMTRCRACEGCTARFSLKELDLSPAELIRCILADDRKAVFASRTLWLASGCAAGRVVCEHGVDFVGVLGALRLLAIESGVTVAEPDVALLTKTFRDQIRSRGRAHHRALLREMRERGSASATEPTQELALTLKGKLRFMAPRAPTGKENAASSEALAYFPGCLTTESAREYDASIRRVAKEAGLALEEIGGWGCCGAGIDPQRGGALARRNVERAGAGRTITSGCPLCISRTRNASPETPATHVLGLFTRADVRGRLSDKIKSTGENRPVGSLKVVCFYGCELTNRALWVVPSPLGGEGKGEGYASPDEPSRPPSPSGAEEESPVESPIELLMETAHAEVVKWDGLRRCCGGYLLFSKPEIGFGMLEKIFREFEKSGADAIVTACPHCHFNLDVFQYTLGRRRKRALEVPVLHFTEVLALAMGFPETERWFSRHVTSPFVLYDRLCAEEEKRRLAETKTRNRRGQAPAKSETRNQKPD